MINHNFILLFSYIVLTYYEENVVFDINGKGKNGNK